MSTLFYRDTRLLTLTVIIIAVAGLSSWHVLPRLEDPELTSRVALIKTIYPGAPPERVEALVTEKIEDELTEIEEIKEIESTSSSEVSILTVELRDDVYETEPVWSRIRDELDDARLTIAEDALDPEFEEIDVKAYAFITSVVWEADGPPNYAILRRLAEELKDHLEAIAGTEEIDLYGDPQEEILVEVDPSRAIASGLDAASISAGIDDSDSKNAAGQLRSEEADLLLEVSSELDSLERVRRTPIRVAEDGTIVQLGDVATISKAVRRPMTDETLIGGKPAVTLAVFVESDFRVDHWAEAAHREVDAFREGLPQGIGLPVVFDQSVYTADRLGALINNLILGALAVVGVIFVIMGWRSAVLVGTALPLSVLCVFAGMNLFGIPIHQMSVTGLIIALGLLIDNAIVVVDEVRRRLKDEPPADAIAHSVGHLAVPLFGSTLTTILAFSPIALMPGPAGEFVGSIATGVILALISSLAVSLTIVPAVTGLTQRFVRKTDRHHWWRDGISIPFIARIYKNVLGFLFRVPIAAIGLSAVFPFMGFYVGGMLPEQFFPPSDRNQFQIEIELPPSASIGRTRQTALEIREVVVEMPGVEDVHWFLGRSAPSFYYNLLRNRQNASQYGQALVQLDSGRDIFARINKIQAELDDQFPAVRVLARQLEQGPPFDAPVEMRVYGPDLNVLREVGEQLREELVAVEHTTYSRANLTETLPKMSLEVDEESARIAGFNNAGIARQLEATLEGQIGGSILEATEELPVRVRIGSQDRGRLDAIRSLELLPPQQQGVRGAEFVPLSAIAETRLKPVSAGIPRRDGRRVNTVQGFINAGVLPSTVLEPFRRRVAESIEAGRIVLPPGYSIDVGGESAARDRAVGNLLAFVGVLGTIMVATLVLSFHSFRMAGIIGAVGFLSVGCGLGALYVAGYPFGFMAIVGTMGLVGVAINDAIVVLAALREDPLARSGDVDAIHRIAMRETRHVVATTITTIAGFIPLLVDGGKFWPPLAVSIAGGVAGATLLALTFVPASLVLLAQVGSIFGRHKSSNKLVEAEPDESPSIESHQRQPAPLTV
ncbi:efflux RND transporter permease subunit [Stratiformator vulcanicus]|uniref:Nickel and cobalt resistance protein CnrA n=1 Tax=Stratiformator vulcanicus TaxID=2527980 RepID=A0A517QVL9_9PLAN|nr:efflux RND transporter permease subunit [Stratiformator vulcanicus]QDT35663.1 Nickel and cobalt resistance protein CnrA [Stratiformator vulcanicus]